MGHFGRPAISRAWFFFAFPALVLNYLGQGALILKDPASISNPFFLLVPSWAQIPMVILATAASPRLKFSQWAADHLGTPWPIVPAFADSLENSGNLTS